METWEPVMGLSRTRAGDAVVFHAGHARVRPLGFLLVTGHEHHHGRSQTN